MQCSGKSSPIEEIARTRCGAGAARGAEEYTNLAALLPELYPRLKPVAVGN